MRKTWRYFRVEGDPPEYAGENLFTVVIHHGGRFYSNLGLNKEYKGGEILYLDGVDADKMSLTELNSWAYDIGYCKGPITFQYKIPGCGFVQIEKDCHVVDMFAQAPESERCIDIYICCLDARKSLEELEAETNPIVDHEKFNGHIIPDIEEEHAVMTGGVTVNHVLNDNDMMHQTFWEAFQNVESREEDGECSKKKRKRSKGKENVAEVEVEEENSDVDPDYIVDSDYDLHSADDDDDVGNAVWDTTRGDLFNDVEEPDSDKSVDSSLLESPKETDEGGTTVRSKNKLYNFIQFKEKRDMKDPSFFLGMLFVDAELFKRAVRKHAVLTKKELRFQKNYKHKVAVVCKTSENCPWYLYASSEDKEHTTVQVKVYRDIHTCCTVGKRVYHCGSNFVAGEYCANIMGDDNWSRKGIQNAVAKDFGMDIGHQVAYRAKVKALKWSRGSIEQQFNNLDSYACELKKRNPGSSIWIKTELEGDVARFQRMYVCFSALKEGWKAGCRPILGLDGCHLKGNHKAQLLSAVGIDANNGMYPVCWAIVEAETTETWTWFMELMKDDLEMFQSSGYAIVSDKQKGLEQAVKNIFPDAEHRFCVRHMYNNFKKDGHILPKLKDYFWAIARATTINQYQKAMEVMKAECVHAWKWCHDRDPRHWCKSHFKDMYKCDVLLNNHSESFNGSILEARKKPIISCLEDIRVAAMIRLATRRKSGGRWRCKVGPRVEKLLRKNASLVGEYRPIEASRYRFEIQGRGVGCESGVIAQHFVMLDSNSCSCRRWDLCGIPCTHAICAIYATGWDVDDFMSEWYSVGKFMQAYEVILHPIAGITEWERTERKIAPPLFRNQPGRPKLKRRLDSGELPPQVGRLQKKFYAKSRCGFCKELGHNARTCKKKIPSDVPEVEVQGEEPSVQVNPPDEPNEPDVHVQVNPSEPQPQVQNQPITRSYQTRRKKLAQRKKYTSQETNVQGLQLVVENEPDVEENNPPAPRTTQISPGKRKKKPTTKMQSPFINPCRPRKSKESQK